MKTMILALALLSGCATKVTLYSAVNLQPDLAEEKATQASKCTTVRQDLDKKVAILACNIPGTGYALAVKVDLSGK